MPIQPNLLLTFKGDFADASLRPMEIWQFGLRFPRMTESVAPDTVAAFTDKAGQAAALWLTHLGPFHNPLIRLRGVRLSTHNEGGLTAVTPEGEYAQGDWEGTTPATAGASTKFPLQTAAVASLMTPRAGASGRGRIFLPQLRYALDDEWGFPETARQPVADAVKNLLVALRPIVGEARVFSGKGFSSPIESVRVGSVPDTQRSRRGAIDEVYSVSPLPDFP